MKRTGDLWAEVVSFQNLLAAAKAAAAGKRRRPDVARFLLDLENEMVRLQKELMEDSYRPGDYRSFEIREPKPRLISAAPFRDRVVHHALTRVVEPIFERRFVRDSYACRKGFGTHRALAAAREGCRRCAYALKCDVRKYFASIDREILKALLARVIKCRRTLDLTGRIIDGSNPQEEVIAYFPGDDLFAPYERRRGLPLGNQTSQFFANVYLNPLDHFIKRTLKPRLYARYVDDFVLFDDDKNALGGMKRAVEEFLLAWRLNLHPRKSRVYRTADGVTFLGWRIFPGRARLVRENVVRFRRRLNRMRQAFASGEIGWNEVRPRVQAWIAHAAHGDTWRLRQQIFGQCPFQRRSVVQTAGRFLEPQSEEPPRIEPQQESTWQQARQQRLPLRAGSGAAARQRRRGRSLGDHGRRGERQSLLPGRAADAAGPWPRRTYNPPRPRSSLKARPGWGGRFRGGRSRVRPCAAAARHSGEPQLGRVPVSQRAGG